MKQSNYDSPTTVKYCKIQALKIKEWLSSGLGDDYKIDITKTPPLQFQALIRELNSVKIENQIIVEKRPDLSLGIDLQVLRNSKATKKYELE